MNFAGVNFLQGCQIGRAGTCVYAVESDSHLGSIYAGTIAHESLCSKVGKSGVGSVPKGSHTNRNHIHLYSCSLYKCVIVTTIERLFPFHFAYFSHNGYLE